MPPRSCLGNLHPLSSPTMFEIHLSKSRYLKGATFIARTRTLANALDLIGEFYEGPLFLIWGERDGLYLAEVYEWIDCWFDDPPVRARIITPRDGKSTDCRIWYRGGFAARREAAIDG